jgi:hypothetical protein
MYATLTVAICQVIPPPLAQSFPTVFHASDALTDSKIDWHLRVLLCPPSRIVENLKSRTKSKGGAADRNRISAGRRNNDKNNRGEALEN